LATVAADRRKSLAEMVLTSQRKKFELSPKKRPRILAGKFGRSEDLGRARAGFLGVDGVQENEKRTPK